MTGTYRGTGSTFYQRQADGTILTYATRDGLPDGRRIYENHMSVEQFRALAEFVLGPDALAKPEDLDLVAANGEMMLGAGALAGFRAAIAMAELSERSGANVAASLRAAGDWTAEMILGFGEQMERAAKAGVREVPIVMRGEISREELAKALAEQKPGQVVITDPTTLTTIEPAPAPTSDAETATAEAERGDPHPEADTLQPQAAE